MSEMIERVARAAYFAGEGVDLKSAFDPANDAHWQHWWKEDRAEHEAIARAAIEAMREPSQAMIVAAFEADDTGDAMSLIRNEWQAMLAAALSPEDEGKRE